MKDKAIATLHGLICFPTHKLNILTSKIQTQGWCPFSSVLLKKLDTIISVLAKNLKTFEDQGHTTLKEFIFQDGNSYEQNSVGRKK